MAKTVLGNSNDNFSAGNGHDQVEAGGGNDTVLGGDGNDTLIGQAGNDSLVGGAGDDQLGGPQAPAAPELLQNGSFEDGTHSANGVNGLDGWFNISGSPDSADDGTSAESWNPNNFASDGTGYITMWASNSGPNEAMGQTLSGSLTQNQEYSLTFKAISAEYTTQWFTAVDKPVTFEILDQNGNVLGSTVVQGTSYEDYEITFTAPAGVTGIQLRPNSTAVGTGNNPSVILDEVSLTASYDGWEDAGLGDDTMDGGEGDDVITGGDGDDSLIGGIGNDTLNGGEGQDVLIGGEGADVLVGGSAQDTADYSSSDAGVDVDLSAGTGIGGHAEGDSFSGVDGIIGSSFDDTLLGFDGQGQSGDAATDYTNIFEGGAGNDYLDGRGGDDTLRGGADDDTIVAGAGNDLLQGDGGDDTFDVDTGFGNDTVVGGETDEVSGDTLDTSDLTADLTLDLSANGADNSESGTLSAGADTITFSEIENVTLGSGDDTVTGSSSDDNVNANGGDDSVVAGSGDDTIDGGAGNDTLIGEAGDDVLSGGAGDDTIFGDYDGPASPEHLDWTAQGTQGTNLTGGFTQTTGDIDVTVGFTDPGNNASTFTVETGNTQYVGTGPYDANSSGRIYGNGDAETAQITLDFAASSGADVGDEVADVSFRINDLDAVAGNHTDLITITAFDAAGNPVTVTMTPGSDMGLSGNTASGNGNYNTDSEQASLLVNIPGPVSKIVIEYANGQTVTHAVDVTDVYFTPIGVGGADLLDGGAGNDTIDGGEASDTIDGGTGDDVLIGGGGDDVFDVNDGFGNDTITGGETGETLGDTLDASTLSGDANLDLSANGANDPESGTLSLGGDEITFSEIETITLGAGDDTVTGSTAGDHVDAGAGNDTISSGDGADTIDAGDGADTVDAGAGDDVIDFGIDPSSPSQPDGDIDTLIFNDGDGNDVIAHFDVPVLDVDGNPTSANDQVDVSGLTDASGDPVDTNDVTVSVNIDGDPVLTFPNGESLTLKDADPSVFTDPATMVDALVAIGIPRGPDGIVSGTSGNDVIDTAYVGDPDGDLVDNNDAILPGDTGDDDVIEAGAGDDTIRPGAGDDVVSGGAGDDTIELGNGFGDDTIIGGETGEDDGGDLLDAGAVTSDLTVDLTGVDPESGTLSDGVDTVSFSEIEGIQLGSGDDTVTGSDGADSVDAGAGDDSLVGGAGDDSLNGGDGDDVLSGGEGADTLIGHEGSDTVDGGAGDDVINTRTAPGVGLPDEGVVYPDDPSTPIDESALYSYPGDSDPTNDLDYVDGGSGNDTILTGDDDDTILGGSGDDVVDAGFDDDIVSGGSGADLLQGNEGRDTIDGGDGDDVIYGGLSPTDPSAALSQVYDLENNGETTLVDPNPTNNEDSLSGGAGNDTIFGGDDNDTLEGGIGNDVLDGGIDDDVLDGGAGDDELIGGQGDDTLILSQGDDTIKGGTGADTYSAFGPLDEHITVGVDDTGSGTVVKANDASTDTVTQVEHFVADETAQDDVITLTDTVVDRSTIQGIDSGVTGVLTLNNGNPDIQFGGAGEPTLSDLLANPLLAGTVTITGGDEGGKIGNISFENFEVINFDIVCFTRGTLILTDRGEVAIEDLTAGMRIATADNGLQPLRWIGSRKVPARGKFAPVRIKAGHFGADKDLLVSQQHRVLVKTPMAELMFGESQVLVPAKGLVNDGSVMVEAGGDVEYFHMLFDGHEIVYSNGAPTESFHPAHVGMDGFEEATRQEIYQLFPELELGLRSYGPVARMSLTVQETRALSGKLW